MGRRIRSREGFVVDEESGEVVGDFIVDSLDEVGSIDESSRRGFCVDEEAVERIISQLMPGIVEILTAYLKKRLCEASLDEIESVLNRLWSSYGASVFRNVLEKRLSSYMSVDESRVYDVAGLPGLAIFRCLRNAGLNKDVIVDSIHRAIYGGEVEDDEYRVVVELFNSIKMASQRAIIRWVSRPIDKSIDISLASIALGSRVRSIGRLSYITTKIQSLGIQITSSKIDISSRLTEAQKVNEVLSYLSRKLGVELSKPIPLIATIVVRLPFTVNLNVLATHESGEHQGTRVKIERGRYTLLVYPNTLNIYARLDGVLGKIDTMIVEALPLICTYINL
jgi:hypothetical protein